MYRTIGQDMSINYDKNLIAIEYYGDKVYLVYEYKGETFKKVLARGTHRIETLSRRQRTDFFPLRDWVICPTNRLEYEEEIL